MICSATFVQWSAISDYNEGGVRDYATDHAALMADFVSQAYRSDVNADGVWNQDDIDLWEYAFSHDTQP